MAIVATDWSIDRATGNIRYIGDDHLGVSPSYATVIEFHRWLQDLADDAVAVGDDQLDIVSINPSNRSTDNYITLLGSFNIDANASEHLFDGSIVQSAGAEIYDGIVNYGTAGITIQLHQNGAVLFDDWWNSNGGLNADATQGISHRFMVPVRTGGVDIDGRRLLGTSRTFGNSYAEFPINGTSRGNNTLALSEANDLNNNTSSVTVAGYLGVLATDINNTTEGFAQITIGGTPFDFFSEWNRGSHTINDLYETLKYITRDGTAETLYGLSGELFRGVTHELTVDTPTGTFNASEPVSWTGGTGQMLAIDSTTAATKMWIQLLTGVAPINNLVITGGTSAATVAVNLTVTERTIATPFIGQSTGTAIIGAYGVGIESADLAAADSVTDLTATPHTPPNNVTLTVDGLAAGDSVLVGPWDGVTVDAEGNQAIDVAQMVTTVALTTANITTVNVATNVIPTDTPATGYIRLADDNGQYRKLHYTAWNRTAGTFTIDTTDGNEDFNVTGAALGNNVYIAYIDTDISGTSESFTGVYSADRQLVIKVRDGGVTPIKEFITSATFGSNSSSITAIRTSDA